MDCQEKVIGTDSLFVCKVAEEKFDKIVKVGANTCKECKGNSEYIFTIVETGIRGKSEIENVKVSEGVLGVVPENDILRVSELPGQIMNAAAVQICKICGYKDICKVYTRYPCKVGKFQYQCPEGLLFKKTERHPSIDKSIFLNRLGREANLIDMFRGKSCFLVCNGPSVTSREKYLLNQPGIISMGINNGIATSDFRPNLWTAQDPPVKFMGGIWEDPRIMKFTLWDYRKKFYFDHRTGVMGNRKISSMPNIFFHRRHSKFVPDVWLDANCIVWGRPLKENGNRSTMLAALHILWFLGFDNIYLLGADFRMSKSAKYSFEEKRTRGAIKHNNRLFKRFMGYFAALQPYLLRAGFKVWNCNPNSYLTAFPYKPFDKALDENLINTSVSTVGMYERK